MDHENNQKSTIRIVMQFVRFNAVGGINTLITFGIYSGLVFLGLHHMAALAAEYSFGILFSYTANKRFTFAVRAGSDRKRFARMLVVYIPMLLLNAAMLWFAIDRLSMDRYIGQAVALVVVAVLSFLAQRAFVFKPEEDARHAE